MEFLHNLDLILFHWINADISNSVFDVFFPFITDLHKTQFFRYVFMPLVLILTIYYQRARGGIIFIGLLISLAITDKIGGLGKHHLVRPRPFEAGIDAIQRSGAGGFSFPSNHAANMFCMAFFLSTFFPKARWFFFTFAFLVAISRVYNGVHYPTDILGGAVLGSLFGFFGAKATKSFMAWIESRKKAENG